MDELLSVPIDQVTDSGTLVFLHMTGFATQGIVYDAHGGFHFFAEDSTTGGFQKVVRQREAEPRPGGNGSASDGAGSHGRATLQGPNDLSIAVIPNPARDRAEVRVKVGSAGTVELAVYSSLGERLATLPRLEADGAGEYVVAISLESVRPGIYLLRAEQNGVHTTQQFNVVR